MLQTATTIFALLCGGVAAVSAAVDVAYWIFKSFSEKWLTSKFDERLAAYKHEQQKELEQLRYKINALMDRTIKLHQKEFDVLPEAWGHLTDAYGVVTATTSFLQQYPDLDQMNGAQLEEFLKDTPFKDWQKDEIRNAAKKT